MAKFEYTLSDDDNEDRVYVRVDDVFDISILRTEEGLIIDVYDNDEIDLLGICGAPFHVVLFDDASDENTRKVAVLFDQPYHCAVLDVAKLAQGHIAFGVNSYRGDVFEPALRNVIKSHPDTKGDKP